ncbi:hypothetical protein GCM10009117_01500 [Gangjinia marincola]|uniref:Uncharacterized protein n=1 Tax=Gangjinia marincola TaxID=578463 RepID=A0ABN1MD69_9FLAO
MKKILVALAFTVYPIINVAQGVAINTSQPSRAAMLYLESLNSRSLQYGGLLIPIVTEDQQALIPSQPADDGMLVYVSDFTSGKHCLDIWDGQSLVWRSVYCNDPQCDTLLYEEDFSEYTPQSGRINGVDSGDYPTGTPWTIDDSLANFPVNGTAQNNDYAYTNGSSEFELGNTDGPIVLTFDPVDISGFSTVCFSIEIRGEGDLEYNEALHNTDDSNNSNDYVNVEYSTDGGATFTLITNYENGGNDNHTLIATPPGPGQGSFPNSTVSIEGLSGSSLIVRVTSQIWAADEFFFYDNFRVEGGN